MYRFDIQHRSMEVNHSISTPCIFIFPSSFTCQHVHSRSSCHYTYYCSYVDGVRLVFSSRIAHCKKRHQALTSIRTVQTTTNEVMPAACCLSEAYALFSCLHSFLLRSVAIFQPQWLLCRLTKKSQKKRRRDGGFLSDVVFLLFVHAGGMLNGFDTKFSEKELFEGWDDQTA